MAVTPRQSLDDYFVENLACSICGQRSLNVVRVSNLPDYVNCTSCQAAFLVEQGGARVLYGKIPESYPETKAFALKKWLPRDAIDLQALKERPSPDAGFDLPASLGGPLEPGSAPEVPQVIQPMAQAPQPDESTPEPMEPLHEESAIPQPDIPTPSSADDQGPPSFGGVHLGVETPSQPQEPVQAIPEGLELNIDLPKPDDFPSPDPTPAEAELPEWLRPTEDTPVAVPKSTEAETVRMPEEADEERFASADELQAIQQPSIKESHEVSHGIEWPSNMDDDLDESNLPDWLQPQKPETPRDKTPDLSQMPGVPIPTEPLSEPAQSGIALESQPRLKPRHYDTLPPQPGSPSAAVQQPPSDLPPAPVPSPKEEISRPVEDDGPGFKLTPNDPTPGERYRVVIKGIKVQLPTDFCAHCGRSPVKDRIVVVGSLPSSKILGQRQATQFNVPLCADCHQRTQHPKDEVQSARLQASLVSTLVAVVVLVLGLAFGLVNLQSTSIPNLLILLVLAAIGYAVPAVILFGRIQDLPVTPEMHYIQSTLIVPSNAQGLETAFEWRNPLYAQRFAELNQQNVVGQVSPIKQRPQP